MASAMRVSLIGIGPDNGVSSLGHDCAHDLGVVAGVVPNLDLHPLVALGAGLGRDPGGLFRIGGRNEAREADVVGGAGAKPGLQGNAEAAADHVMRGNVDGVLRDRMSGVEAGGDLGIHLRVQPRDIERVMSCHGRRQIAAERRHAAFKGFGRPAPAWPGFAPADGAVVGRHLDEGHALAFFEAT